MSEEMSPQELQDAIQQVAGAETENFAELAQIAGLASYEIRTAKTRKIPQAKSKTSCGFFPSSRSSPSSISNVVCAHRIWYQTGFC